MEKPQDYLKNKAWLRLTPFLALPNLDPSIFILLRTLEMCLP